MSHDEDHITSTREKLVRMANQIAAFFHSKPREEGIAGVAEHINKFWEPRMRQQFFEMLDSGTENFDGLVVAASARIKRPKTPEQADVSLGYTQPTQAEARPAEIA
ncbi:MULTISPECIES: formate dehydrogenase subunit delta [unclassified Mesorhizobium]|uniref:formate dehydrogenase subunit delta n=1 Tax=unclassified Mesorhizobium TaxID=325217 RepID=UPI000FD57705|nr:MULTISPECIES: formate dehydrogenase subunit delta [unclassified Mesorhizobium]RUV30228.1 formate dehydrogenase [Mesorhizobium sp. M5C.F.Ca.IN.020.32.2.1]RWC43218.1 MAG: formate dehydrogenase [Mesorhizobium sp.]RWD43241.1 MAG: formate dehydrogenase [Mesorhizobium sp.]RWE62622.1 MAG: formate dehydrogenase [Mesorhizobium sp.]RWE98870.1 MAG: formate dehydrogenase [Mesorhizobium sp.]